MRRPLFNVLAGLSLALCLATVAAAIRGFWINDNFIRRHIYFAGDGSLACRNLIGFNFHRWGIEIGTARRINPLALERESHPQTEWSYDHSDSDPVNRFALLFGTYSRYVGTTDPIPTSSWSLFIPYWIVIALTALEPVLAFRAAMRERQRRRTGICPICGYDLRATPDRCPECGRVPEKVNG
jgi:hypothetical protein